MLRCPTTRWVLAGYSQGAMVVAQASRRFRADRVIYIGLVADPQTYLPEGRGLLPDACLGRNYSEYRVFVPACRTHTGRLGARNPYQYGDLAGKYGLWCGKNDYVCGSTASPLNNSGHTQYVDRGSYAQMSYLVQQKMTTSRIELQSKRTASDAEIYAMLAQDEYYAYPGDIIRISAENSFSFGTDVARFEWAIDNNNFMEGGAVYEGDFPLGSHVIKLRVSNNAGLQSEAMADVYVVDSIDDVIFAPPEVEAGRQADAVYFTWQEIPEGAKYLLVRLNGFDLAYVDADELVAGVHDLELNDDDVLSVAWMDEEFNVGDESGVEIGAVPEVEVLSHEQDLSPKDLEAEQANAPQTGVEIGVLWVLPIVLFCAVLTIGIKNTRRY